MVSAERLWCLAKQISPVGRSGNSEIVSVIEQSTWYPSADKVFQQKSP